MLKKLTFHLSPESYVAHTGKLKEIGEVYVQLDEYVFPDKEWTDFAFNIIYWWMDAFIKVFSNEADNIQCKFMDGNYRFDVKKIDLRRWSVQLIAERETDEIWQEGEVDPKQATEAIVQLASVLAEMERKKGNGKAADNYKLRIQILLNLMNKSLENVN